MIRDFLADVCVWKADKTAQNQLQIGSFSECVAALEKHYYLVAISDSHTTKIPTQDSDNCRLQLIEDDGGNIWLLKAPITTWSSKSRWHAINLRTLKREKWSEQQLTERRARYALLFEIINTEKPLTERTLTDYIYKPMARLYQAIIVFGLASSMIQSSLFMAMFYLINVVVPYDSPLGFYNIALFMLLMFLGAGVVEHASSYLKLRLSTEVECRRNTLVNALTWRLNPTATTGQDIGQHLETINRLCDVPQAKWTIRNLWISNLTILPILILMFFRLPLLLFISALLCAGVAIAWMIIKQAPTPEVGAPLNLQGMEQLAYYRQTSTYLDLWYEKNSPEQESEVDQQSQSLDEYNRQLQYKTFSLLLVMLFCALSIQPLAAYRVETASVFTLVFLVTNLFNIIPRLTELVRQILNLKNIRQQTRSLLKHINRAQNRNNTLFQSDLTVQFHKVILKAQEINIRLGRNEQLGVLYHDDASKNQLVSSLLGLQKPDSGHIKFGALETDQLSAQQRQQLLSYAGSDSTLIEGSLRQNLLLFALHRTTTQQERRLQQVLIWLELDKLMQTLPLGLDTPITHIDKSFSTGERQRLVMAQALMKPAQILIVNNALAGLEEQQEQRILARLTEHYSVIIWFTLRHSLQPHVTSWFELHPPSSTDNEVIPSPMEHAALCQE